MWIILLWRLWILTQPARWNSGQKEHKMKKSKKVADIISETETLLMDIKNMDEEQEPMSVDDVSIVLEEMQDVDVKVSRFKLIED